MAAERLRAWAAPIALALLWGLGPALPAWTRGELLGQPWTDLYPAVWGMQQFAEAQPGFPLWWESIAAPEGMGFYYASPLLGWAAAPLLTLGLPVLWVWNLLLVLARGAGVLLSYAAGRAWGMEPGGALGAAALVGAAPLVHGFAVEGIPEGNSVWALALWLLAVRRWGWIRQGVCFGLLVLSSWYLAAAGCLLALALGPPRWRGAGLGLLLAAPALLAFLGAFPARAPLDEAVRLAMGTDLLPGWPGWQAGIQPFAKTSWTSPLALLLIAWAGFPGRRALALAGGCWVLSTGWGPWYELPIGSSLRFPYRLHLATLVALSWSLGLALQQRKRPGLWAALIALEGWMLSPVEPLIPGAPAELPALYESIPDSVEVVLDLPGPVAMPPGAINRSRPRARWFLYALGQEGKRTPWRPDFNAVGVPEDARGLEDALALDPLSDQPLPEQLILPESIEGVLVHTRELGRRAQDADRLLRRAGWQRSQSDGERWLYLREEQP